MKAEVKTTRALGEEAHYAALRRRFQLVSDCISEGAVARERPRPHPAA